jgi:hypothetical protein
MLFLLRRATGTAFAVTDVNGNEIVVDGQPFTITGTNFGTTQGVVTINNVRQTVGTWANTQITGTTVAPVPGNYTLAVFKP